MLKKCLWKTVVLIYHGTLLSFHFRDTGNQHNHWLTNASNACILMVSRKSQNATNKNTKRSRSIATGCVKISKYLSCFQLHFNASYFAWKMRRNSNFMPVHSLLTWSLDTFFCWRTVNLISEILSEILILLFTAIGRKSFRIVFPYNVNTYELGRQSLGHNG